MHFKHPELLYALFLLVIPLLVHLFQLRKFRKESFTNVRFLKKASLQTRKSSQIKKWLILLLRLLLLASVIIAFAQPFFPVSEESLQEQEVVIFLDNSYSMQAKGAHGNLLKKNIQDLLENLPQEDEFSLFTNNVEFKNVTLKNIRKELQNLSYSPTQLPWKTVFLKAENLFLDSPDIQNNFILISDFQNLEEEEIPDHENRKDYFVQTEPGPMVNISIDTAFISERTLDEIKLKVEIGASEATSQEIPIAIYNGKQLLAKRAISIDESTRGTGLFSLPAQAIKKGRIEIEDTGLEFDNQLFFSINKQEPIQVVGVGSKNGSFLERIYKSPDFDLSIFSENRIDFNALSNADLVILNQPEEISLTVINTLQTLVSDNIYLAVIPSGETDPGTYNPLFRNLGLPLFQEKLEQEKLITDISFGHPLFESVFEQEIDNFHYPKVNSYFRLDGRLEKILAFENGEGFLVQRNNVFIFTAGLGPENSNFQNTPLIVPTFYNMGNLALTPTPLYFVLGKSHTIDVNETLERDEILELDTEEYSFIPMQQSYPNKVEIRLEEEPYQPGQFEILRDSINLKTISFNINRSESNLDLPELSGEKNLELQNSVPAVFEKIESQTGIQALWKCFVIFALFLIVIEMLILKFFK